MVEHPPRLKHDRDQRTRQLQVWRMRWFITIAMVIWAAAILATVLVVFCVTGNTLSFSLVALLSCPLYVLRRVTMFLFPLSKNDVFVAALQVQHKKMKGRHKQVHTMLPDMSELEELADAHIVDVEKACVEGKKLLGM